MAKEKELAAADIKTLAQLERQYPDMVAEVRQTAVAEAANADDIKTLVQLTSKYPELVAKARQAAVAEAAKKQATVPSNLKVPGFLLEVRDPYAAGVLRQFAAAKCTDMTLPAVLPYNDPHSKAALKNYILRAKGACDTERAAAATKALAKTKK